MNAEAWTNLLSPEGSVLTDPAEVDRALGELWKPPSQKTDTKVATRICKANLLVIAQSDDWPKLSEVLGELSPVFPTRTIVVLIENADTGETIHASVSAICHVPQPSRPQVCCEQIVLRCSGRATNDLDRTIVPLLASEVPVMIWWRVDPAGCLKLFHHLQSYAKRLILDTGLAGFKHLEPSSQCAVRELGWYRIGQRRELIAHMFDGAQQESLKWIEDISIHIDGTSEDDWIDACWLVAFIGGQLGWQPAKIIDAGRFEFASATQTVKVRITTNPLGPNGMQSITINSCSESYVIQRCPGHTIEYRIIIHNDKVCRLPRSIEVHRIKRGRALPASLNDPPTDPAYNRAAPLAGWMA